MPAAAAPLARRALGLVFPRSTRFIRAGVAVVNLLTVRLHPLPEVVAAAMWAVNGYSEFDYAESPTVFFEGTAFEHARRQRERSLLWRTRHEAYPAILALRPGSHGLTSDVCVPVSRLAECIEETRRDMKRATIPWGIAGHVVFIIDPKSQGGAGRGRSGAKGG